MSGQRRHPPSGVCLIALHEISHGLIVYLNDIQMSVNLVEAAVTLVPPVINDTVITLDRWLWHNLIK